MAIILGIDTGGTYTDSVIIDIEKHRILKKAKAFTTRNNLLIGISESLDQLQGFPMNEISMVCLSTTLATNAVVEHKGGRVGALLLGRPVEEKLPAALTCQLKGMLDIKGRIVEDISEQQVRSVIRSWENKVDAIAISGFASVRNSIHETRVRDIISSCTDLPIVCAHELSSALGHQERTVTAILNAALIPNIRELIDSSREALRQRDINTPIMIVKGDGSLMRAEIARTRPIETVLSGPAASIIGGLYLSGEEEALILDMGGTTTDLAEVRDKKISLVDSGAVIGGWHTHLRAAEISTFGVGGDSRIYSKLDGALQIGPQRVLPLCVAAELRPELVEELKSCSFPEGYKILEEQAYECYSFIKEPLYRELDQEESRLISLLKDGPHCLAYLMEHMGLDAEKMHLSQLVDEGVIQRCGLTPTDLLHVMGKLNRWNSNISIMGVSMLADHLMMTEEELLDQGFELVIKTIKNSCIQAGLNFAGTDISIQDQGIDFFINGGRGILSTNVNVELPIIALGAPVEAWIPRVSDMLHTKMILPEHAEVANAVGAAVGQIVVTEEVLIRPDQYHKFYIVHAPWGNHKFSEYQEALEWADLSAREHADRRARAYGCVDTNLSCDILPKYSAKGEEKVFIQTKIMVTAVGSPIETE